MKPITASSTGKPPIRHLACLVGARPGRVRRDSNDLDLLTRVSISEDIDPNLHTPTKDTVIPFADPNPMTPPSPPTMHLPPQESPTPELKQPPLPMTHGDDEDAHELRAGADRVDAARDEQAQEDGSEGEAGVEAQSTEHLNGKWGRHRRLGWWRQWWGRPGGKWR